MDGSIPYPIWISRQVGREVGRLAGTHRYLRMYVCGLCMCACVHTDIQTRMDSCGTSFMCLKSAQLCSSESVFRHCPGIFAGTGADPCPAGRFMMG